MKSVKKSILFLYFSLLFFKNINAQGTQTFQSIRFFNPNTSGQYISLLPPNGITSYGLTLPATQGAANTLLLNNGSGTLSWSNGSGLFWGVAGNAGTVDATNFLGTTDNVPLNFRVNNEKSGRIETGGGINAFGYQAGANSTATFGNTYIGHRAGRVTTANNNTFVGYNTGVANITGANNAFFGTNAGPVNTATDNTFLGFKAGLTNTSGQVNTFVGSQAGEFNITGNNNTFLGFEAGKRNTASDNNYIGYQAGRENATGDKNVAIGKHALNLGTAVSNNIAIGFEAGYNSNANNNTAVGHQAGRTISTGTNNTFLGYAADATSTNFTNATAVGYNAKVAQNSSLILGGTGADLVKVGIGTTAPVSSMEINGENSPILTLRGNGIPNTNANMQGRIQLFEPATTDWGMIIDLLSPDLGNPVPSNQNQLRFRTKNAGVETDVLVINQSGNSGFGTNTPQNKLDIEGAMVIGATYSGTNVAPANGLLVEGNVGINTTTPTEKLHVIGNILASGTITSSDIRFKKNIKPLENALTKVGKIRGVTYELRADEFPDRGFSKENQIGFIAQELEKTFPEFVVTSADGYKAVDYARLTPVLVEAIKELKAENELIKKQLQLQDEKNTKAIEEIKLALYLNK